MSENPNQGRTLPFHIEYEDRGDYLFARVSGDEDSYEVSLAFWSRISEECIKRDSRRLLVEEDFPTAISLNDMYRLVAEVVKILPGYIRVAFLDVDAAQFDANEFGGLVANNRGANVLIVKSVEEAEQWLRQE